MVKLCCICKLEYGTIADISFHSIPKKEEAKAKWFLSIGREVNKHSAVCSRHFKKKEFHYKVVGDTVKRFLAPTAVPSLLFTQSNSENVQNQNIENKKYISGKSVSPELNANENDSATILLDASNVNLKTMSSTKWFTIENSKINTDCVSHICKNIESATPIMPNDLIQNVSEMKSGNNFASTENLTDKDDTFHFNENIEINVLDESQYVVGNTEHIERDKILKKTVSKRTMDKPYTSAKRFYNPRYIGDLRREDFTSDASWKIVQGYVQNSSKQRKLLYKKVKRLNEKVQTLKALLDYLQRNRLLSNENCNTLEK